MARAAELRLCEAGCESDHPGHELTFMRFRMSVLAKNAWQDALVESVSADGRIRVRLLDEAATPIDLWHHRDLGVLLPAGSPIAVNTEYWMLSGFQLRISVERLES